MFDLRFALVRSGDEARARNAEFFVDDLHQVGSGNSEFFVDCLVI